jgi:flavin-dependent dehydrogenase
VGDIYPKSCKVYHQGQDCVCYNQHPSRRKLRRGGINEVFFGYSWDFPFQLTNITVVVRTRTNIFQGRDVNKYLLKNMERMYTDCEKESLWIRSELSENCFHSVFVKII